MPTNTNKRIYEGGLDTVITQSLASDKLVIVPDAPPTTRPDMSRRLRIMWGHHMLDDLLAGRYRSLVCAVNPEDNSRGLIGHLARLLPTSHWSVNSITEYARQFASQDRVTVLKYDMDTVEVLALLRPTSHDYMTLDNLSHGFRLVTEMIRRKTERLPTASVSFLGANANKLVDEGGHEPSFEKVLRTMHEAGFSGDVYPAPFMWEMGDTALFARYPFPESLNKMREGGY